MSGPMERTVSTMAYDSRRGVTVLFGGVGRAGELGDTWEWNGSTWTQVATTGPSRRANYGMVYDSTRGVTVLFGGATVGQHANRETWE